MTRAQGLRPAGEAMATVAARAIDGASEADLHAAAFRLANMLVPPGAHAPARGAPRIWAHLWMEVNRMARGDVHG